MAAHAKKFSPSGAHRDIACPGRANACANIPRKPSSPYAMEGTIVHQLGGTCLKYDKDPKEYKGWWGWNSADGRIDVMQKVKPVKAVKSDMIKQIDDKMIEDVSWYVNAVQKSKAEMPGAIFKVEEKLDLTWLLPGVFGTGDHIILQPLVKAIIDDYKNGANFVEVENNTQLKMYGLMALGPDNPLMVEDVVLRLTQPNDFTSGLHPVREWAISAKDLYEWGYDVLKPAYDASLKPDAPLIAGSWCKWCDNDANCPELRKSSVENMFGKSVAVNEPIPPMLNAAEMTSIELDRCLELTDMMDVFIKAVKVEAQTRLEAGHAQAPTAFKMIEGKLGNNAWLSPETVSAALGSYLTRAECYDAKIKTPAKVKAALKAKGHKPKAIDAMLKPLLKTRKPGKPSMVSINHKKPALAPLSKRMFE